ncbi:autotransporter outer membrane beta-barrel domain-containing protein [Microvirga roseola]|uniref:autotransporter outer membrane beta-barrel domain-containing protein n=1 Tax=Microvirga roseola TaxID=2883126 RepID=UPI001E35E37D|nr:autotransporter domain-containing protein [Microvirga roseola]
MNELGTKYKGFSLFEKLWPSTWTLTGDTTFGGQFSVRGGTIIATSRSLPRLVQNTAAIVLDQSIDGTYEGSIAGSGSLTKSGSGTVTLTGTNSYTGGTRISGGTIQLGAGGTTGSITGNLANGGTLAFNRSDNVTFAGAISGAGRVVQNGAGTLTLSGTNSYSGGTQINSGVVAVSSDANLGSSLGDLNFDGGTLRYLSTFTLSSARGITLAAGGGTFDTNGFDTTISQALRGTGPLTKEGAARLNLTGTSTLSGPTYVEAGRLAVNGSLASSAVTVRDGAILSGTGTVGSILAQSGAIVAPGNSIGTLNVSGNVGFAAGSIYEVEINAAGQSDRVATNGVATLLGGTVSILPDQGAGYVENSPYTILTAAGVTGNFARAAGNFAFVDPVLGYSPNAVTLMLVRKTSPNPPEPPVLPDPSEPSPQDPHPPEPPTPTEPIAFNSVAVTPNQHAIANAVEALGAGNRLFDIVLGSSVAGARQAFTALSGEVHASAPTMIYDEGRLVREAILTRLRPPLNPSLPALFQGTYNAAYAADQPGEKPHQAPVTPRSDPRRFALWGQGFGSWGNIRSNGNAASIDTSRGGFIIGADAQIDPGFRIGAAGGFSRTIFDLDSRLSSGTAESVFGALYGSGTWGAVNVRLGSSYAWHDIDTKRSITFPGFSDQASVSYDGSTLMAFGEVGYGFNFGLAKVEPFIGAAVTRLHTGGFVEDGGAAALTGYGHTHELATATLGLRAEARISEDLPLAVRGMLGWRRAYGDMESDALLAFAGSAFAYAVSGIPVDLDALVAEVGLNGQISADMMLGLSYSGQVGARAHEHAVKGNLTWRF